MGQGPTILLGVGATKAGTSWLYEQLARHPDCHLRGLKELHYFDTLENGSFGRQISVNTRKVAALEARVAQTGGKAEAPVRRLADLRAWLEILEARAENLPAYLRYLTEGAAQHRLVADITPAYALLPVDRLRQMAAMAPDVRFVYILRDPLARMWSHVRMLASRAAKTVQQVARVANEMLEQVLAGAAPDVTSRGDYAGALTRLNAAVDPARLLVLFQEHMLTEAGVARLAAFLGLSPIAADFTEKVHQGLPMAMTDDQKRRARAMLRPQYDYVARQYPDLPEVWRKNMGEDQ